MCLRRIATPRVQVGNKPAVVANALKQAQYCGDGYVEVSMQ